MYTLLKSGLFLTRDEVIEVESARSQTTFSAFALVSRENFSSPCYCVIGFEYKTLNSLAILCDFSASVAA